MTIDAKGKSSGIERSGPIFNADEDPLFTGYAREGDMIYFASFMGSIYQVDVSGPTAKLVSKYSIVEGVDGRLEAGRRAVACLRRRIPRCCTC